MSVGPRYLSQPPSAGNAARCGFLGGIWFSWCHASPSFIHSFFDDDLTGDPFVHARKGDRMSGEVPSSPRCRVSVVQSTNRGSRVWVFRDLPQGTMTDPSSRSDAVGRIRAGSRGVIGDDFPERLDCLPRL